MSFTISLAYFFAAMPPGSILSHCPIVEESESHTYIFVSISVERLKAIIHHELDLRRIFLQGEDDFVYKAVFFASGETRIETIGCAQIPEDWLPTKDEFISTRVEITEYLVNAVNQ